MKQFIIIMIVLGCIYGRGIPKKPNSKRNYKDKSSVAHINPPEKIYKPSVADIDPPGKIYKSSVAHINPPEKIYKRESISSINMKHGLFSDIIFKDDYMNKLPNLWIEPNKHPRVPYEFDFFSDQGYINIIEDAIAKLNNYMNNSLCASYPPVWVHRTSEFDYVVFTNKEDGGCWSRYGKVGGRQELNIGRGCNYTDTVLHEMLHAMGFLHEQNRCDCDTTVKIVHENIKQGKEHNFDIDQARTTYTSNYDIWSIMQYDLWAFSKYETKTEDTKTIKVLGRTLTKDEEKKIGNPPTLSDTDKLELNIMYGCLAATCTVGCDGVERCLDEHSIHDNLKDTIKHSKSTSTQNHHQAHKISKHSI